MSNQQEQEVLQINQSRRPCKLKSNLQVHDHWAAQTLHLNVRDEVYATKLHERGNMY